MTEAKLDFYIPPPLPPDSSDGDGEFTGAASLLTLGSRPPSIAMPAPAAAALQGGSAAGQAMFTPIILALGGTDRAGSTIISLLCAARLPAATVPSQIGPLAWHYSRATQDLYFQ